MLVTRRRRSRTTILIFRGIGTKEAIFTSTAGTRPAAIGRVDKAEKAKYDLARYNLVLSPPSYLDMRSSIYIDRCIYRDGGWESKSHIAQKWRSLMLLVEVVGARNLLINFFIKDSAYKGSI